MSDEEKKTIDDLFALIHINSYIDLYKREQAKIYTSELSKWQNAVKTLLNRIEKKEKVIDEMTKYIERTCYFTDDCENNCDITDDKDCNKCIKECFYRKVKENE